MHVELIAPAAGQELLAIARRAFEARVHRLGQPELAPLAVAGENRARGAFVTIRFLGELRGCLGRLHVGEPLPAVVAELAASVADSDPRFEPVLAHELRHIDIELSVLGPERLIESVDDIQPGRHGLIVEEGERHGLLLPQVAAEEGWDRETFLEFTCRKAYLPPDAWRRGARIFTFEAQIFQERSGGD